jgi:hypothetical protein
MVQIPICSIEASKQFNNFNHLIKLMWFLVGLDNSYQSVRTNFLLKDELHTVKEAFAVISREESHMNSNSGSQKGQGQNVGFVSKTSFTNESKKKTE